MSSFSIAPRHGRVVRAAHRSGGDVDLRSVTLMERRHQLDRIRRGHRHLENADAVQRVCVSDRLRRFRTVLAHHTDDLFLINALQQFFPGHEDN